MWLERDEMMWKQRSRVLWLQEEVRNSRFFYVKASDRRRKNRLNALKNKNGVWVEKEELDTHIIFYF